MHLKEYNGPGWSGLFWLSGQLDRDDVVVGLREVYDGDITNHYSHFSALKRPCAFVGLSVYYLQVSVVSTYLTGAK
jgi:hypothetical protein